MARHARVQIADPSKDSPAAWALLAVALPALLGGVAAAGWLLGPGEATAVAAGGEAEAITAPAVVAAPDAGAELTGDVGGSTTGGASGAKVRSAKRGPAAATRELAASGGETAAVTATEAETAAEAETATVAEAATETEAEAVTETEAVSETEGVTETEAEAEAEAADVTEAVTADLTEAVTAEVAEAAASAAVQASTPAPKPEPSAPATEAPSQDAAVAFKRGRVAYVRCEGIERPGERFPCPRDRVLESRVWRMLAAQLPQCLTTPGIVDVRLEFKRHIVMRIRTRVDGAGLTGTAVEKCVGRSLRRVRTALAPDRMIVSFRFSLD